MSPLPILRFTSVKGFGVAFKVQRGCNALQTCFRAAARGWALHPARAGRRASGSGAHHKHQSRSEAAAAPAASDAASFGFQRIAQFIRRIARKPVPGPTRRIQRRQRSRHLTSGVRADHARAAGQNMCRPPKAPCQSESAPKIVVAPFSSFLPRHIAVRYANKREWMRHFQFRFRYPLNLSARSL